MKRDRLRTRENRLHAVMVSQLMCISLQLFDLRGALEHLPDLPHDLRVHALSLLQLLAIAVDNSGGSLGNAKVLLYIKRQICISKGKLLGDLTLAFFCSLMSTM